LNPQDVFRRGVLALLITSKALARREYGLGETETDTT
jgi:hypothetical protein